MDLSHLTVQRAPSGPTLLQPAVWDWRTQDGGRVTSVKNQGACGSCYAFAGIGNFESKMLMDGEGTFDYSEENAKECNWRELNSYQNPPGTWWGSCDGGNYYMLASLFSQGGVVLETDDPYNASDTACTTGLTYQKTLLDWRIISDFTTVADTNVLKDYIYTYGPVYTTIYVGDGDAWDTEFGAYDGTYTLEYGGGEDPNHAVLIAGWSNNLPATTGAPGVPADGWIVKNSWGTGWGDNGYFYITYGSAQIGRESSFMYDWQDYDTNGDIWYYDEDTWNYNYGWNTSDCGMVRFTPPANTWGTRIEFWTNDISTTVDAYLYDSVDGTGNPTNLLQQQTGNFYAESGYHSVELNPPVQLTSGDDVYAVACFSTDTYAYPIPCDSESSTETGRTWISDTGPTGGFWFDLGTQATPCDVGIRLRTSASPTAVELAGFEAASGGVFGMLVGLVGVGILVGVGAMADVRRRKKE
jgi:C1A family cysteine protease